MSGAAEAKNEWIARVLNFAAPVSPTASGEPAWTGAIAAWRSASDTVDAQIAALQSVLKSSGDDELVEIAEYGLNAVTGGFKVPLLAVLHDIATAGGTANPALLSRARDLAASFRAHLEKEPRVRGCDENPFGVHMSIRQTLSGPLAQLEAALRPPA